MPVSEQLFLEVSCNSLQSTSKNTKLTFEGVDKEGLSSLLKTLNSVVFDFQRIACTKVACDVIHNTSEGRSRDRELGALHDMLDFSQGKRCSERIVLAPATFR
jgi:hypothetical protein